MEICLPFELLGKGVFLFLNSSTQTTRQIREFIKFHGGHIFNFLDKKVDAIIIDKTLLRKTTDLKLPKPKFTRSQQMVDKANKKSGSFSVESFAAKWSIPIIDYKEILYHCKTDFHQQDKSIRYNVKKLQAPFIKVEDQSRKYRPEFVEFKSFPFMDITVPMSCSPFDTWYKQNSAANKDLISIKRDQQNKQYFCELCGEKYAELQSHLDTAEHKHAAMDNDRYAGVDALIKQGVSLKDFERSVKEKNSVRSCDDE